MNYIDKQQFLEKVIVSVRALSISQIVSSRISLKREGRHHKGFCPFHNDNKLGSFIVTDAMGIYKCFSCGAGGDAISFIANNDGLNYVEAAFKIALDKNIISYSEYQEYYERRVYTKEQVKKIEKIYIDLDKNKFENAIAEPNVLNEVYQLFIQATKDLYNDNNNYDGLLSLEHKELLLNGRKLSEVEIINDQYFTFPTRRVLKRFAKLIRAQYGKEDILGTIPGFYKEAGKDYYTFTKHSGIGIPIRNAFNIITGIQVRNDKKIENRNRYIWFSSSFANYDDRYSNGTSSGSPIDVIYPKELKIKSSVFITEGRFKAQQIAKEYGAITISVQGVSTWKGIITEVKNILTSNQIKFLYPDIPKNFDFKGIMIAFDADMNYKYQVYQQANKMSSYLQSNNYSTFYVIWNEIFGKGIDDLILSGNKKKLSKMPCTEWDLIYSDMTKTILDETEYLKMVDVPQEVLKEYFIKHMNHLLIR